MDENNLPLILFQLSTLYSLMLDFSSLQSTFSSYNILNNYWNLTIGQHHKIKFLQLELVLTSISKLSSKIFNGWDASFGENVVY